MDWIDFRDQTQAFFIVPHEVADSYRLDEGLVDWVLFVKNLRASVTEATDSLGFQRKYRRELKP